MTVAVNNKLAKRKVRKNYFTEPPKLNEPLTFAVQGMSRVKFPKFMQFDFKGSFMLQILKNTALANNSHGCCIKGIASQVVVLKQYSWRTNMVPLMLAGSNRGAEYLFA